MTRSASTSSELLGRDAELEQLTELTARAARGEGSAVLIRGEAGTGKTALAHEALQRAQGFTVLRCRGVESELSLPYGALHALLGPLLGDLDGLGREQRTALDAALSLRGAGPASPIEVAMATLTLLTEASDARPLAVLLDDAHWIDEPSLDALSFVARRIEHDPVLIVATARPVHGPSLAASSTLDLQGLDEVAVRALAERTLGRALFEGSAAALVAATGGNPLAVVETARSAGGDVERLGTIVDEPLPVDERIGRAFVARIDALDVGGRTAALVLALSIEDSAETVHRALDELGAGASAIDEAERGGVIVQRPGSVAFTHPLLRAAAFHQASSADQRAVHDALSRAAAEPGVRAWHAASACQYENAAVADDLAGAATEFSERGGHLAAAKALERAARLTPDSPTKADRLYRAARDARYAARATWAASLLDEAAQLAPDRQLALLIAHQKITFDAYTVPAGEIAERFTELATEAEHHDREFAVTVWSDAMIEFNLEGRIDRALRIADHLDALMGDGDYLYARGPMVEVRLIGGDDPKQAAADAIELGAAFEERPGEGFLSVVECLAWTGRPDLAARVGTRNMRHCQERGKTQNVMTGHAVECTWRFAIGDWAGALNAIRRSVELAVASRQVWQVATATAIQASIHAVRGDAVTIELAGRAERIAVANDYQSVIPHISCALGSYSLGLGRPQDALEHLEQARDWSAKAGHREPAAFSWPVDLVDAYVALGRRQDALVALDGLQAAAEERERTSILAACARLRGLLASDDEFVAHFERSAALFDTVTAPFHQARMHLHFGARLRRAGQRKHAAAELERARTEFARLGAKGWLAQTVAEQDALGGRRATQTPSTQGQPHTQLTAQEAAVADLVTQGMTNKEVAAQLFLTPKTIEWHLRQIYRKLGIRSRAQLAAHVSQLTA